MGQPRISLKTTGTDQFHISWTAHQFNLQIRKQSLQTIASHSEAFDKAWPLSNRPHRLGASSLRMAVRPLGLGNSHYRLFQCKTRSTDNPGDKPAGCGRNLIGRSDLWALPSFARSPTFLMPEAPIAAHRNFILGCRRWTRPGACFSFDQNFSSARWPTITFSCEFLRVLTIESRRRKCD